MKGDNLEVLELVRIMTAIKFFLDGFNGRFEQKGRSVNLKFRKFKSFSMREKIQKNK